MERVLKSIGLIALLVGLAVPSFANSTIYGPVNITSLTSSLTINASTSGMTSKNFNVQVYSGTNGSGYIKAQSTYGYTIDGSYNVTITFSPSISTGSVYLQGVFNSNTTASTDWQVTGTSYQVGNFSHPALVVCSQCTSASPAVRTYNGSTFVLNHPYYVWIPVTGISDTMYVYILDNQLYYGISAMSTYGLAWNPDGANGPATLISGYPTGSVPLGHSSYVNGVFGTVTDDRPTALK